jgi:hypothetical protein
MRFDPPQCPQCGQLAKGVLETIPGLARLLFEDGNAEYAGSTDVYWDGQEAIRDEQGRVRLRCPDGHEWLAEMSREADDVTAQRRQGP